jgi:hypothetical protein
MKQIGGCFENQTETPRKKIVVSLLNWVSIRATDWKNFCLRVLMLNYWYLIHTSKNSVMISLFKEVTVSVLIPVSTCRVTQQNDQ